ncbi:hypothetical protein Fuma_04864 [Fuerstiella marisgermanici]|uniref:Uncharacterized protein n=1 Tax=Fuerstiella marisgermanici TaxID=1891926 RepID=A0A1P8WMC8_9PLAN|nr:hypothetical protein Fuma_04864 [Fuerstiella marisgermanici]
MKPAQIILVLLLNSASLAEGPPTSVCFSNNEFGYDNRFEIGPGSVTGVAHYKWFGTDKVQDDLLHYRGSLRWYRFQGHVNLLF